MFDFYPPITVVARHIHDPSVLFLYDKNPQLELTITIKEEPMYMFLETWGEAYA